MLEYDRKKLGKFLKETREKTDLTQTEVAHKLGYSSPQFISNIERGTSVAPLATLSKMMSIYRANPEPIVRIILESQTDLLRRKLLSGKKTRGA